MIIVGCISYTLFCCFQQQVTIQNLQLKVKFIIVNQQKQTVINFKLKTQHTFTTRTFTTIISKMATAACSIYGLFITCVVGTLLGIATLILSIVFNYIGFVSSDISISTCTQSYLITKYNHLTYQLQTSFVGTCLAILMLIIAIVLIVLTIKNLRSLQSESNPQLLSEDILSKTKYAIVYILLSVGTLGNIVCFGIYLSILIEAMKDPSTCSFNYNRTNLLILVVISGIWLLSFIIAHVFALMLKAYYTEDEARQSRRNKYKEMINVTEEPGLLKYNQRTQQNNILNHAEYTEEPYEGDSQSFGNNNRKPFKSIETQYLKPYQASQLKPYPTQNQPPYTQNSLGETNKSPKQKQTFEQYRDRQMRELIDRKNNKDQNDPYNKAHNVVEHKNPNFLTDDYNKPNENHYESGHKNENALKFYLPASNTKSPNQANKPNNNIYNASRFVTDQREDIPKENDRNKLFNKNSKQSQQLHTKNAQKSFSPIRMLGDPANEQLKSNGSPYKNDTGKSPPQRVLNKPEQSYRGEEDETRGQLVFYKKAMQKSRNDDFQTNERDYDRNNDPQKKDKYSSGELSFKSPSRFDSKFAQQEKEYLNRNAQSSILPSHNFKQVTNGSRKIVLDDKYSSSGMINSNFGQSRNQQFNPSQSRSKAKVREGVLTSFIRGKFS